LQEFAEYRAQTAYATRLEEEERDRQNAEQHIRKLEEEEEALISRLRMAYDMQRTAYSELEGALDV